MRDGMAGVGSRTRWRVPAVLTAVFTGLVLLVATPGSGLADAEAAQFLLKAGKDSLAKKKYDDALARFAKALQEDASLAEARYWSGVACDGKKDLSGALGQYRAFLKEVRAKVAAGGAPKSETALVAKAETRLDALAPGERDLARLDEQYASQLLAFARAHRTSAVAQARRALAILLDDDPTHPVARALLHDLDAPVGPPGANPDPPKPPGDVASWEDLMASRYFGVADGWTWTDGLLTIDRDDYSLHWPAGRAPRQGPYRFEVELRLLQAHRETWRMGVGIARVGDAHFGIYLMKGRCILEQYQGEKTRLLEETLVDVGTPERWHHLSVRVDGTRIEVWVDGKRAIAHDVVDRVNLDGQIGVIRAFSKAEYRAARFGVPE